MNRSRSVIARVVATILFACCMNARHTWALSMVGLPRISSLEWMAADADLVLRGTVTRVEDITRRAPGYETFTLRVEESLTGPRPNDVRVLVHRPANAEPAPWEAGAELLVFLVNVRRLTYRDMPTDDARYCLQSVWLPDAAI